jgi:hypothetical protein
MINKSSGDLPCSSWHTCIINNFRSKSRGNNRPRPGYFSVPVIFLKITGTGTVISFDEYKAASVAPAARVRRSFRHARRIAEGSNRECKSNPFLSGSPITFARLDEFSSRAFPVSASTRHLTPETRSIMILGSRNAFCRRSKGLGVSRKRLKLK